MAAVALALGQAVSVQAIDPQELLAPIVGPVVILPHVSLSESYDAVSYTHLTLPTTPYV